MEQPEKLDVKVGTSFTLELPSNLRPDTPGSLSMIERFSFLCGHAMGARERWSGQGGKQFFEFVARKRGEGKIRMRYRRAWSGESVREAVYDVSAHE